MATVTVRKFAISVDPEEVVDFTDHVDYFSEHFDHLGFERSGTYTWRWLDTECMVKGELTRSQDGFFLYVYVQALDEHVYRVQEVAESFNAHVVDISRKTSGG